MSVITASGRFNMIEDGFYYRGTRTALSEDIEVIGKLTKTEVSVKDGNGRKITYSGNYTWYEIDGGTELNLVASMFTGIVINRVAKYVGFNENAGTLLSIWEDAGGEEVGEGGERSGDSAVNSYLLRGNDVITGSKYDDYLIGGSGDDVINGGAGNDIIDTDLLLYNESGTGIDIITGGKGKDYFIFASGGEPSDYSGNSIAKASKITDFSRTDDKIAIFADDSNNNPIETVYDGGTFTGGQGKIHYIATTNELKNGFLLSFDTNGDSSADYFLNVITGKNLTWNSDYLVSSGPSDSIYG